MLVRLKFRIDFSGLLTLLIHFSVSLLRVLNDNVEVKESWQLVLLVVGSNLVWFSLYYFTSELQLIKNSLEAEDHKRYLVLKNKITVQKYATLLILFLYSASNSVIYYYSYSDIVFYNENLSTFNTILIVSRVIKIIIDVYFHVSFFRMIMFLFRYRVNYIKEELVIKGFQKFLVFLVIFLYFFSFFHAILITVSTI